MKYFFLLFSISCFINGKGQTVLTNAIVKATIEIKTKNGDGTPVTINGGNIEVDIFLKDSMSKIIRNSSAINSVVILNGSTGVYTNLSTMKTGEKIGFTYTTADIKDQKRRIDSISSIQKDNFSQEGFTVKITTTSGGMKKIKSINYLEEFKSINGIPCKKAIVTTTSNEGSEINIFVWFTDIYLLPEGVGGENGLMSINGLKGLPIYYETVNSIKYNGIETTTTTIYQVIEIKPDVKIDDMEFLIPKEYKIKTYAEWVKNNPGGILNMQSK